MGCMLHRYLRNPHICDTHVHTDCRSRDGALYLDWWPRRNRHRDRISRPDDYECSFVLQCQHDPNMAQRDVFMHSAIYLR